MGAAEPAVCTCGECRALDRRYPEEGHQLSLIGGEGAAPSRACVSPEAIVAMLRRARLRVSDEAALQGSIADTLTAGEIDHEREARLGPADRIDFLAGGVGIEAKTRCPKRTIFRQLERYAAHDGIDALILVTGTALGMPAAINGKPVYVVSTGRAAL